MYFLNAKERTNTIISNSYYCCNTFVALSYYHQNEAIYEKENSINGFTELDSRRWWSCIH
jgi:hypothetical protein